MCIKRGSLYLAVIVLTVLLLSLVAIPLSAEKSPKLKLDKTAVNLGVVYNTSPSIEFVVNFTNEGREMLRISEIRTSCPCLTTDYPRGMVAHNEEGEIKCTLNLQSFVAGNFEKKLQIFSNSSEEPQVVVVKGEYKYKD